MLGKLIKHELRATGRIMLPFGAAILGLSLLSSLAVVILDMQALPGILNTLAVLTLIAFFLGLFAICVMAFVQMIQRFYRNLLGDEGYLMFTLPTTPDALIFSKLIVSAIWFAATLLLCGIALMIFLSIGVDAFDIRFVGELAKYVDVGLSYLGNGSAAAGTANIVAWVLELIALFFVISCAICLRFYAAMAIGQSFDNRKILMSVVFYFIIGAVMNTLMLSGAVTLYDSIFYDSFVGMLSSFTPANVHKVLLGTLLGELVTAVIYYIPTTLFLRKKLNLA